MLTVLLRQIWAELKRQRKLERDRWRKWVGVEKDDKIKWMLMWWSTAGYTGSRWTSGLALDAFKPRANGRIGGGEWLIRETAVETLLIPILLCHFINPSSVAETLSCVLRVHTGNTLTRNCDCGIWIEDWRSLCEWLTSQLASIWIIQNHNRKHQGGYIWKCAHVVSNLVLFTLKVVVMRAVLVIYLLAYFVCTWRMKKYIHKRTSQGWNLLWELCI